MWKLLQSLWMHALAAGGLYLVSALAVLLWLGRHPARSRAEAAVVGLLLWLVVLVIGSTYAYARRTLALTGQLQTGWVLLCALLLIGCALAAALVTVVALNQ